MKKKYLILGGNGFIGSNLCRYLISHNNDVTSFDHRTPQVLVKGANYIAGDFFDDKLLKEAVDSHDFIYHAVSTINPGNSNRKYLEGYSRDFIQTVKLCSWLVGTDKTLIFLSSGGTVYGRQSIQPITELALPQPINHYGNLKLCIENTLKTFNYQEGVNIRIARISNPYGPGQDYTKGVGFVDAVLKHSLAGEAVELWGDGENIRDYIYIDDVCSLLYFLSYYNGSEMLFNISSGNGISQNQVIDNVRALGLNVDVIRKESRSVDVSQIVLDNTKIKNICCESSFLDFKTGIKKSYDFLAPDFCNCL